jgi:hypothetical protein
VAATIDTGPATGEASRDQSLPTSDWFNIKAFPQAEFKSSQFKKVGPDRYIAQGQSDHSRHQPPGRAALSTGDQGQAGRDARQPDHRPPRLWCRARAVAGTEAVAAHVRVDVTIEATR